MMYQGWAAFLVLAALPGLAAIPARRGMLNYIEGQARIGSENLESAAAGSVVLSPGQTLQTSSGHAEILLTPGVFLRLNNDSAVRMISPGLTDTRVEVLRGQAMLEAFEVKQENNLRILSNGAITDVEKDGLYRFDADRKLIAVYDGKARVEENDATVDVKGGRAVALDKPVLKTEKFDKKSAEDELYKWSKVRSEYLAEANAASAPIYVANNSGWYGPGWYWNPWFSSYTFIPGSGVLYSPFGWGFASPLYGYYYGPRYWGAPVVVGRAPVYRRPGPAIGGRGNSGVFRPGINPGMVGRGGPRFTGRGR